MIRYSCRLSNFKGGRLMKKVVCALLPAVCFFVCFPSAAKSAGPQEKNPEVEKVQEAIMVCQDLIGQSEEGIPKALLHNAQAIAVIPGVVKAAYIVGGQHGKGVLLARQKNGAWSYPVFINLTGGSIGFQVGAEKADIILVFKDWRSVRTIAQGKFTLGGDASVAAGPVGAGTSASTDIKFEAEVYSYSKAKGLFGGISLKGAALQIDKDADAKFYRSFDLTTEDILDKADIEAPQAGRDLREAIAKYAK
jgi:lipid-binding SYLF domain-containing protein